MFFPKIDVKTDPVRRWHRPDRHFFANGACQVLAFAFLERYPDLEFRVRWIKPATGFIGNHIYVTDGSTPSTITASPPNSACWRWCSDVVDDSFLAGTQHW
jgi:hypothetical protein